MSCNSRIAAALSVAGLLSAMASTVAFAGSPLLSGYGGPGSGEQAIVGSTLLGGPSGTGGSGGSSGTAAGEGSNRSSFGGTSGGSSSAVPHGLSSAVPHGSSSSRGHNGSGLSRARGHARGGAAGAAGAATETRGTAAFVYPSSLRSASADSPVLGIPGGDLPIMLAIIAGLALVGALTLRVSRLQR